MKMFKNTMLVCMAALIGAGIASCSDANEFEDARTDNPSWVDHYNDTLNIPHPETLAATKWTRATGIKKNVYGEEIQGYVESIDFVSEDSVAVKMSVGTVTGGMGADDSNTEELPYYYYEYSSRTGTVDIMKTTYDDKKVPTRTTIFTGVAVLGKKEMLTIVHFGDTPVQTYLVKQ